VKFYYFLLTYCSLQAVHVRHRLIDAAWETEILAKVCWSAGHLVMSTFPSKVQLIKCDVFIYGRSIVIVSEFMYILKGNNFFCVLKCP